MYYKIFQQPKKEEKVNRAIKNYSLICVVGIRCSLSPFLFFCISENSYNKSFKGTEVFKEEAGDSRLSFSTQVNDDFPESSFPEKEGYPINIKTKMVALLLGGPEPSSLLIQFG